MQRLFSRQKSLSLAALLLLPLAACNPDPTPGPDDAGTTNPPPTDAGTDAGTPDDWPAIQSAIPKDPELEKRIDTLLSKMSLEEKVGQITQVEISNVTPDEVKQYHLGSVLNGGGAWPNGKKGSTVAEWNALADQLWAASVDPANGQRIPIIWGVDAVHGHNNVKGATLFPHNIGLGAANDPELVKRIGEVTAREVAQTGLDWAFGPTVAVVRDDRWGRTYEGYSEDPAIVESFAGKIVEGLQGQLGKDAKANEKVIASVKHFLGDGATNEGKDQGVTRLTEKQLRDIHGRGYFTALAAGSQTVMASFNSWQDAAQGETAKAYKMHGNKYLLTDVLKTKMGFDGFVISDWNGIGQITRNNSDSPRDCTNGDCPQAINAGVDMVMVPYRTDWKPFITNTIASVKNGEIPQARLDDAVRRILRVKLRLGLFEKPKPSERNASHEIGTAENRAVAREAVRKSLVLLKNNGGTLPLARSAKVLVAGKSADNLSNQSGGWSITWQGTDNTNADFGGGTTLWEAIRKIAPNAKLDTSADGAQADASYDVAVVVIGETPYAEGNGDIGKTKTLELARLRPEDYTLLQSLKAKGVKKIVTVLFSGRPLYTNKELNVSDAFVAAWLPGTEGEGLTDVLFRKADGTIDHDFHGKLSFSWPKASCQVSINKGDANYDPLFAYGYGLTYAQTQELGAFEEKTQTNGCGVEPGDGSTTNLPLTLFERGNQDDWVMRIGAPSNWGGIDVRQGTSNTTSLAPNEISVTPVDDEGGLQWAAVNVKFSGTGQVYMQNKNGNEGRNLQPYLNSKGALVFAVKVNTAPSAQVNLSTHCIYPCQGEIQITETLKGLAGKGWSELAVPLQCFADKGLDFGLVNSPFLLYTSDTLDVTLASIRWEPNRAGNVSCTSTPPVTPIAITDDKDAYVNGVSDTALFATPNAWTSGTTGTVTLNPAFDIGGGEKVIDVVMSGLKEGGGNGGIAFGVKDPNLLDVSAIAETGGVQFEVRVLDYGQTTQDFWVKSVCDRKPDSCTTGDLKNLLGHPAVGSWTTVKMPFSSSAYPATWNKTKVSAVFEMLPAWGDQGGNIHFQVRNVRIKKQLQ
ncbi:Periplasmic beta-glucosidase [Cystobacter fuscus DSM 2262]|uniref:Periplasmic beta-glucosidase n=1 Tax=Cystobacter fuscus (strain ATCC 25194 / DSM 2262 / NBRC 100088 / M29) TaxID=1242864 RepID=S9PFG6_CYSF2|nr:exo 1,3/1,4-beta-D-glucan glucohydrolase [Cystobacter fuscus]EPX61821.1 Periplasmic beta-glucosidase [Cystobacter fuscus DSM 2262]